jgi:hypothetical protein
MACSQLDRAAIRRQLLRRRLACGTLITMNDTDDAQPSRSNRTEPTRCDVQSRWSRTCDESI